MTKTFIHVCIVACCLLAFTQCGKPKEPDYIDFQNLRIEKASLEESVIRLDIRYYNPNKFKMQLKEASMDVYFNNKFLGHSTLDSLINIPKKDTFSIPVSMQVKMKDLLGNAAQLLINPNVMVKLQGNARVGRSGIFANVPINYEGMQKIDLSGALR
ncbi:MAG TPA: LEA type 2 family protein [Chitinophagaceae bacterium]|nr:LEA type 2 family protein [Chitinophagaceae bacterium]